MLSRQYTEFKDYGSYVISKTNEVPRSLYCQQNWLFNQREQTVIKKHSNLQHPAPSLCPQETSTVYLRSQKTESLRDLCGVA